MIRYVSIPKDDVPLRTRLEELASERRRFGYRRLAVLLRRDGWRVNIKRVLRVYREAHLQVRKRLKRRVAIGRGDLAAAAVSMNERWSLDFVHDTLESGRRIRTLNIVDDFTRECLAIEVDTSLSGHRVARVLDAIGSVRGFPQTIVMDNELRECVKGSSTIGRASTSVRGRSAWRLRSFRQNPIRLPW
jgi:putative transposase